MSDDLTLVLDRHIKASPANVWRCWTDAALLREWFAPKPVETVEAEIDASPGGRFYTLMRIPEMGDMAGEGCVLLAEPEKRLVTTNLMRAGFVPNEIGSGEMDFGFTTDIRLALEDGGTRYVATVYHATAKAKAVHEGMGFHDGWGTAAGQLEELAASL